MMNKRLVSLLVSLMLVFCATAGLAEGVYESDGFNVSYPEGWVLMDKSTIAAVTDMVSGGQIEGIDPAAIAQYAAQIDSMDMVIVMSADSTMNANFIVQAVGMQLTPDMILPQAPSFLSQYEAAFSGCEVLDPGSVVTYGENEYVQIAIKAQVMGAELVIAQLLCGSETNLHIISITTRITESFDETVVDAAFDLIASSYQAK